MQKIWPIVESLVSLLGVLVVGAIGYLIGKRVPADRGDDNGNGSNTTTQRENNTLVIDGAAKQLGGNNLVIDGAAKQLDANKDAISNSVGQLETVAESREKLANILALLHSASVRSPRGDSDHPD